MVCAVRITVLWERIVHRARRLIHSCLANASRWTKKKDEVSKQRRSQLGNAGDTRPLSHAVCREEGHHHVMCQRTACWCIWTANAIPRPGEMILLRGDAGRCRKKEKERTERWRGCVRGMVVGKVRRLEDVWSDVRVREGEGGKRRTRVGKRQRDECSGDSMLNYKCVGSGARSLTRSCLQCGWFIDVIWHPGHTLD